MAVTIDELQVDVTQPTATATATPETGAAQDEAARTRQFDALLAERARIAARLVAD
jgi:hypothetical protein